MIDSQPHSVEHRGSRLQNRSAFTLVEMLVSVALVLLIMSLFAQIFQMAAGSISAQQGIAENDQQARMIAGFIRGDLEKRSMRLVQPFTKNEDTRDSAAQLDLRQGYFYYAENDPADQTDDVLQFTVLVNLQQQTRDATPLVGIANSNVDWDTSTGANPGLAAISRVNITGIDTSGSNNSFTVSSVSRLSVGGQIWVTGSDSNVNDGPYQIVGINGSDLTVTPRIRQMSGLSSLGQIVRVSEPDLDDGVANNASGTSAAAEVSYFLRGGNLYRRVLLIRPGNTLEDAQPKFTDGGRAIWVGGGTGNGNYPINNLTTSSFWRDFDYSAFHFPGKTSASSSGIGLGMMFHAVGPALSNAIDGEALMLNDSDPANPVKIPVSLGIPNWRFGHNRNTGFPREFLNTGAANSLSDDSGDFIGRFLAQETAHTDFGYPGRMPSSNPFTRNDLTLSSGLTTVVNEFTTSNERRGDDLLMTNVLAFDVKLRDPHPASLAFVDLGDTTNPLNRSFRPVDCLNTDYSPTNNLFRFDTWHPLATAGTGANAGNPPFRPDDGGSPAVPRPVTAIQITVVYQNRVDGRIRQVTIEQSLQDHP